MDLMKTEYEFLDLSDVKEAELSSLQCALYESPKDWSTASTGCSDPTIGSVTDTSGASSVAGDVESGGMAPHSPPRAPPAQPPVPPHAQHYPHYAPQWHPPPPNVYVSQVTANVNVHGYMGQYYQPPQQYAQVDRPQRPQRSRERRGGKRVPSPPPPQQPPYYVQYPQYYPAAQAQGAPLYHLPMYQPVVYPYTYPPYYPEYPLPVEGEGEKPEEYTQEVVMEQEAVDAYYANAHYAPPYGAPVEGVEYMPPMYLPPPAHAAPLPLNPPPPHHHTPHQFNVHAKTFVHGQSRNFVPQEKQQRQTPPATVSAIESQVKELKINKGQDSPKEQRPELPKPSPPIEKVSPKMEVANKPAWVPNEKPQEVPMNSNQMQAAPKSFPPSVSANQVAGPAKIPPVAGKPTKGPTAPFANKQVPKPQLPVPQVAVPVQQAVSTPKAPFGNRQKRETVSNRSPTSEEDRVAPVEHVKREPPLPPSKAPMPISITLHSQGVPVIVANKPPFGHSRKSMPEPVPAPQPPPPAPTASDFPPPPTPRNRGEPAPAPVQPQPQPAPGKSWASLFASKSSVSVVSSPPAAIEPEPSSPTTSSPPIAAASVQKPVAKVQPFDASPSAVVEKAPIRPVTTAAPTISYSEKTSVNAVSNASTPPAKPAATPTAAAAPPAPEVREVPVQKEPTPALPVPSSPFTDDPNSYRMGEFLSKYQLDNRPVTLLPRGLTNRSNYCYVNAILQALIACPPFYNMLKALPYQTRRGKSSTPVIDSMVELCYEFSPLTNARPGRSRGEGPGPSVPAGPPLEGGAGLRVLRALRPFAGSQDARQEDAEEFLGCLLNSLNDEMLELVKLVEPDEVKLENNGQQNGVMAPEPVHEEEEEDDDDDEWKVMGPRNRGAVERRWAGLAARRTPLADIFRGRTRLRLHRALPAHNDVTDAVQPFFTLHIDIERSGNVKDALELLAGKDALEGADAWQQLALEQLPVVLLLHLKCFQLDPEGHTAKIVKNIDFPIDLKIDQKMMSAKVKYTSKQRLYKLFAVVYHEGVEAVKGHYLTDTYHGQAGWIRYDDSTVTQVTDAQVLKPKPPRMPYILMYRRHDTLPAHRPPPKPE